MPRFARRWRSPERLMLRRSRLQAILRTHGYHEPKYRAHGSGSTNGLLERVPSFVAGGELRLPKRRYR
eukprot:4638613-Pleurochrysis_carterae.AAC.1